MLWYLPLAIVNLTSSAKGLCPGDAVVFTCVTDTGRLTWKTSTGLKLPHFPKQLGIPIKRDIFMLTLQNITGPSNNIYRSTAYTPYVPLNYNEENITCTDTVEIATIELAIGRLVNGQQGLTSDTHAYAYMNDIAMLNMTL